MFCPQCGQQQASDAARFCSRCGFQLAAVSGLLATGGRGAAPEPLFEAVPAPPSPKRKGVQLGGKLMLSGMFLGPALGLLSELIGSPDELAIVGVNRMMIRPMWRDGQFVPRMMMNLSSSFDHRIIDGYEAAQFIRRMKELLEAPALLLVRS